MERRQAIIITTGMDNSGLSGGLTDLRSKMTALAADVKRGLMPISMTPEVAAFYRKLGRTAGTEFSAGQAETMATINAAQQAAIARGSIPEGWATQAAKSDFVKGLEWSGGAVTSGYAFSKGGKLLGRIGESGELIKAEKAAAAGLAQVGRHSGRMATIFREIAVMIREGFRGNFSRMVGSFSILIGAIGVAAAAVVAGTAAVLAVPGFRTWKAIRAEKAGAESEKVMGAKGAAHVRQQIEALKKAGRLTDSEASQLTQDLRNPDNLVEVWNKVRAVRGGSSLDRIKNAPELARLDEEHKRKMLQYNREDLDTQGKYTFDLVQQHILLEKMSYLQKDSVEWKTMRNRLDDVNRDVLKDQANLEKEKAELIKKQTLEKNKAMRTAITEAQLGAVYPTLEQLAGSGRTDQLNRLYGKGGRFDLSAGNGPFAAIAFDAELAQKQQMWDRIHGNLNQAELDRRRYNLDISQIPINVLNPQEILGRIGENTGQLRELFDRLVTQGAIINTNIAGVSG